MTQVRILYFDIETTPLISYTWGLWQQNVIAVKEQWYILSFSYRWADEKKVHNVALPDFRARFKKDRTNDFDVVKKLHSLLDQADIVIGHNSDKFDLKKVAARCIFHGLKPLSPIKTIDTLKIARKFFAFTSNKLDDLAEFLNVGVRKLKHQGIDLWLECMAGPCKAWDVMSEYNDRDVVVLSAVYDRLKAWQTNPVDLNIYTRDDNCRVCQSEDLTQNGFRYFKNGRKQQYQCRACGHYSDGKLMKYTADVEY
jgi:hypothetical protein